MTRTQQLAGLWLALVAVGGLYAVLATEMAPFSHRGEEAQAAPQKEPLPWYRRHTHDRRALAPPAGLGWAFADGPEAIPADPTPGHPGLPQEGLGQAPGDPERVVLSPQALKQKGWELLQEGRTAYLEGDLEGAHTLLKQALAFDPTLDEAKAWLRQVELERRWWGD